MFLIALRNVTEAQGGVGKLAKRAIGKKMARRLSEALKIDYRIFL
jgi:hypothetical protein